MLALPLNKAFFHLPYGFYLTTCKSGPYWKRLFFICALLNWLSLCWKSEFKIFSRWIDSLPWHDHPSMAMKEKITVSFLRNVFSTFYRNVGIFSTLALWLKTCSLSCEVLHALKLSSDQDADSRKQVITQILKIHGKLLKKETSSQFFFSFFKNNKKLLESFKASRSCFFQSAMLLQDIFVIDLSKKSCNDNLFGMW